MIFSSSISLFFNIYLLTSLIRPEVTINTTYHCYTNMEKMIKENKKEDPTIQKTIYLISRIMILLLRTFILLSILLSKAIKEDYQKYIQPILTKISNDKKKKTQINKINKQINNQKTNTSLPSSMNNNINNTDILMKKEILTESLPLLPESGASSLKTQSVTSSPLLLPTPPCEELDVKQINQDNVVKHKSDDLNLHELTTTLMNKNEPLSINDEKNVTKMEDQVINEKNVKNEEMKGTKMEDQVIKEDEKEIQKEAIKEMKDDEKEVQNEEMEEIKEMEDQVIKEDEKEIQKEAIKEMNDEKEVQKEGIKEIKLVKVGDQVIKDTEKEVQNEEIKEIKVEDQEDEKEIQMVTLNDKIKEEDESSTDDQTTREPSVASIALSNVPTVITTIDNKKNIITDDQIQKEKEFNISYVDKEEKNQLNNNTTTDNTGTLPKLDKTENHSLKNKEDENIKIQQINKKNEPKIETSFQPKESNSSSTTSSNSRFLQHAPLQIQEQYPSFPSPPPIPTESTNIKIDHHKSSSSLRTNITSSTSTSSSLSKKIQSKLKSPGRKLTKLFKKKDKEKK